jgi:hydroxymethylpyrimidine pyrophosphatase-like HAD family hydrolase
MKQNIIAVDFDGTLCENKWPEIGMPNEELIEYLKKRQANGEKLILWTSRNESVLICDIYVMMGILIFEKMED